MLDLTQLTEFLGWASVLNIAYLCLATIILMIMKGPIASIHSKMLDIKKSELGPLYFKFLGNYKIATLVFIVAPYIALKIMGY
jgi:TctA family transporter